MLLYGTGGDRREQGSDPGPALPGSRQPAFPCTFDPLRILKASIATVQAFHQPERSLKKIRDHDRDRKPVPVQLRTGKKIRNCWGVPEPLCCPGRIIIFFKIF